MCPEVCNLDQRSVIAQKVFLSWEVRRLPSILGAGG